MYNKILLSWIEHKTTEDQIHLFVRTKWLTQEQAETILNTPRN
jgi:hypothetical protein